MTGIYIHIPFCASRCIYCGFYSTTQSARQDEYIAAVCHEMELRRTSDTINSVYIGGGTPSQLSAANLRQLFLYINNVYSPDWGNIEVTMECNPDDVTEDFCRILRDVPVSRISMGAQTFSDRRLRFLHRRHTSEEVATAVHSLRNSGIGNISVDLMFGFPRETLNDWLSDIQAVLALGVEHISAYSLQYEEGTTLYNMLSRGDISEIDDELYRSMYTMLCDELAAAGYEHYEISNFARPGFRSRHNASYWHDVPYIGLGASAHSYTGSMRSWNVSDLSQYISAINIDHLPSRQEKIDDNTHYDDTVMTALRTCDGIAIDSLQPKYRRYILAAAKPYLSTDALAADNGHLRLTPSGIFISDMIMSDLMIG